MSHPGTEETLVDEGETASGLWCVLVLGLVFVWCFCLVLGLLLFFSPHHVVFPSPSMMTWALRPHGVRTRGKNPSYTPLRHSLVTIWLPNCLSEIRAEVFVGCNAIERLTLPDSIRYLGYRAFGDCTELSTLEYAWSKQKAWRHPYAADNAFEGCLKLTTPKWLHRIPAKDSDWIAPCN